MKRPEWAAAGTFPEAWAATRDHERGRFLPSFAQWMADAHVIVFPLAQLRVLPRREPTPQTLVNIGRYPPLGTLPFNPVFLCPESVDTNWGYAFLGALFVGEDDGSDPHVIPISRDVPGTGRPPRTVGAFVYGTDGWIQRTGPAPKSIWAHECFAMSHIMAYFLESANVALTEAEATRQQRRAAERHGGRVALTVSIRQPKRRPRSHDAPSHPRDWSHRWEVRGHYKHFPVGTKLADSRPDKLVDHPTLGQCRRIWCPPHVKGPESKPLVPKLRVVAA